MRKAYVIVGVIVVLIVFAFLWAQSAHAPNVEENSVTEVDLDTAEDVPVVEHELIRVSAPVVDAQVSSPLRVTGVARGYWFFEASFPIVLVDWDGKIIAEHYATAESDWMTEDFVPFTANLDFVSPYHEEDPEFMSHGTLILRRDNPSGLPENDGAIEIPVRFSPTK